MIMSQKPDFLTVDYSKKNLKDKSFANLSLTYTSFKKSDLRGADFTNADLTGADLRQVKTGLTPQKTSILFILALAVSMGSCYGAIAAGNLIEEMIMSSDLKVQISGFVSILMILSFIVYYYLHGGQATIKKLLFPLIILLLSIGLIAYYSGIGTGKGMFLLSANLLIVVVMVAVGTLARAIAGILSHTVIFILVASAGSIFGATIGGGVYTAVLALSCVFISKRALDGATGFEAIRRIAEMITRKWGTSFKQANLTNVNFTGAVLYNADFTNSVLSGVNWMDSKKENCIPS